MKRLLTAVSLAALFAPAAHAVDGCKFLLCISGNWKAIPMCVPTVQEVLSDLAKGGGWPSCDTSGPGNNASHSWTTEASCPEMYRLYDPYNGHYQGCVYAGAFKVQLNAAEWSTVYWSWTGDTSTWYTAAAKVQLGSFIDPKYDADQAAWDKAHPPPPPCWGDC